MFVLSLFTFYGHRDFGNEYFNHDLINRKLSLNKRESGYINLYDIKSNEDFRLFMTSTIAH